MNFRKGRLLASAVTVAVLGSGSAFADNLSVGLDQTRTVHVDQQIATLSIGNPAIADVNVRDGKTLFVLGKSFGRTNVLALDNKGQTVLDVTVLVTSAQGGAVTVYRGTKQSSYDCATNCQRALVPGDDSEQFDKLQGQISTKVKMGTTGGTN